MPLQAYVIEIVWCSCQCQMIVFLLSLSFLCPGNNIICPFMLSDQSDFVRLDKDPMAEGNSPLHISTSSHSSEGSSLSGNFRFVRSRFPYPHDQARARVVRRQQAAVAQHYCHHDDGKSALVLPTGPLLVYTGPPASLWKVRHPQGEIKSVSNSWDAVFRKFIPLNSCQCVFVYSNFV